MGVSLNYGELNFAPEGHWIVVGCSATRGRRVVEADEGRARYDNHGFRFDRRWRSSLHPWQQSIAPPRKIEEIATMKHNPCQMLILHSDCNSRCTRLR